MAFIAVMTAEFSVAIPPVFNVPWAMILQKSFWGWEIIFWFGAQVIFILLLMLKTVVLLTIFCGNYKLCFFINRKFKRTTFIWNRSYRYYRTLCFSVTFNQCNVSLLGRKTFNTNTYLTGPKHSHTLMYLLMCLFFTNIFESSFRHSSLTN